ncbi:MAG: hypothetical protein GY730_10635 [bacterium]|nr:hypothetical protein [bacterium]
MDFKVDKMADILNDEIDYIYYIKTIFRYKIIIAVFVAVSLICCAVYNEVVSEQYSVSSTFFVPLDTGGSGGSFMGYARLMGVKIPSNIDQYVISLLESQRMKDRITEEMLVMYKDRKVDIEATLKLGEYLSVKKNINGIFILQYKNTDQEIALKVVERYLENLNWFNKELEITAQKNIITVLDLPVYPEYPSDPKKKFNFVVVFAGAVFFSVLSIFIYDFIRKIQFNS